MPILGQETINKAEIMGDHSKILHALEIFPFTFVTLKKVEFYVRNRLELKKQNKDILIFALNFLKKNPFLAGLYLHFCELKFLVLFSIRATFERF